VVQPTNQSKTPNGRASEPTIFFITAHIERSDPVNQT
jgi:hypothetical protein